MREPSYIIAIGASAGGIEEINTFFEHTPLDGVAYVIVQHLSADFKSRMAELLSKHSKLLVKEASEGMAVCTNMVYLIPNNKFMTIQDNKLYLTEKIKMRGPHLTINTFFKSLAAFRGSKAIGVILSGLGSDGTEGIKAIKEAGGMIIARNPETTEFSSMPAHAIATDMVDFILEPQFMPKTIDYYVKHNQSFEDDKGNEEKNIALIVSYMREKLPFDFTDYKMTTILRRTKRRAASLDIYRLEEYLLFLKEAPDEVEALAKDFLISVTTFFRDADAFEAVEKIVLPQILESLLPHEEIKIWVPGCATGEEAYSLAIMFKEMLAGKYEERIVKIFATDIDSEALLYAGKGTYGSERIKNISKFHLNKYFDTKDDSYTVRPEIRKMLIFAQHDLVKNPPYCNMHLISCRNLLIYMAPVLQQKVYAMLLFGLKTNGFLFLGSSENPLTIIDNLEVVDKKWRIYKNLKNKRSVSFETFAPPEMLHAGRSKEATKEDDSKYLNNSLTENINSALAYSMDFLAICIDHENTVIKSYGNTAKYLMQQNFKTNLVELLPRPLAAAYNALSKEVFETNEIAKVKGIVVKQDGLLMKVTLTVSPVVLENNHKGLLAVFNDDNSLQTGMEEYPSFNETEYNSRYIDRMAEELKQVKQELMSSYRKLDASNENMQSFNEELISANEEMQSTNEEMQSVNEELHTINADYQLKNKELLETNDDLNNYFRSNINGQLFIDDKMRLMKFSPGAVKHINLVDSDIGRPISHISTNIKFETILADTKSVLENGTVIKKEIEAANGKWYQIMIMPYIQASHRNKGAIITFNDISELKETQLELKNKNQSLMRINADLDHFIYATSHDLLAPLGNIEASITELNELNGDDGNVSESLLIINSSIQTFRSLITDIATIAKVEGDLTPIAAVSMDEIINNIEWSLTDRIASSGAKIIRKFEIAEIQFSKKNLRSILYNLIANAIKFRSQELPEIIVSTFSNGESCVITVEDNGKGIKPNEIDKIFEMYGRLQQDIEGSGIGLFLAKKIINAAGGSILVESHQGKGTKFILNIGSTCNS